MLHSWISFVWFSEKNLRIDFKCYAKPWLVALLIRLQCIFYWNELQWTYRVHCIYSAMKSTNIAFNETVETTVDFITGNQWVTVPSCDVSSCMSRPVSSSSSASYGRIRPSDRERWSFWRELTLSCVDKRLAEFDRWRSPDDSFSELLSDTGCRYDILRPDGIEKRDFRRVDIFL